MTYTIASSCVCTSPLAVMTIEGLNNFVKVSISALLRSFFADHVHWRTGVHKQTLFPQVSTLMQVGTYFPETRRMLLFHAPFILTHFLASFHACFAGTLLLPLCLLSETRSSIFGALELRLWGSPGQNHSKRWIFYFVSMAYHGFSELIEHIGLVSVRFELFRTIDEDFGGSISWNTQSNCRVIFKKATALLSPFFSDLLPGCSSTWRCG